MGVFSEARFINAYYVAVLTPAICALAGIGIVTLWRRYQQALLPGADEQGVRRVGRIGRTLGGMLLPLAILLTGAEQANLMRATPDWPNVGALILPCALVVAALGLGAWLLLANSSGATPRQREMKALPVGRHTANRLACAVAAIGLGAALIAPFAWSSLSLTWGNSNGWPVAEPQYADLQPPPRFYVDPHLIRYLLAHRDGARFVLATTSAYYASPIIIATGLPVMALGGFGGSDPTLSVGALEWQVEHNSVHYFLLPSSNVTPQQYAALFPQALSTRSGASLAVRQLPQTGSSSRLSIPTNLGRYTNALTAWVSQHCAPVPPPLWSSAVYAHTRLGATELFACQAHVMRHLRHMGHSVGGYTHQWRGVFRVALLAQLYTTRKTLSVSSPAL